MKFNIALLAGDGIGPEVTEQAVKTLDAIADVYNHTFKFNKALVGACAIDETGAPLPEGRDRFPPAFFQVARRAR